MRKNLELLNKWSAKTAIGYFLIQMFLALPVAMFMVYVKDGSLDLELNSYYEDEDLGYFLKSMVWPLMKMGAFWAVIGFIIGDLLDRDRKRSYIVACMIALFFLFNVTALVVDIKLNGFYLGI